MGEMVEESNSIDSQRSGDRTGPVNHVEEELFEQARKLAPESRSDFLDDACRNDRELRQRIDALLESADRDDSLLDLPATKTSSGTTNNDSSGETIGNYKLLDKIGEGGMGSVYMAEQVRPVKRMVALKVIRAGLDSKQVVARFEAERQSLALMDHPNIAMVLDAGETEKGEPYFVMELVKGLPITEYCNTNRLGPKERVELMVAVCGAVQHAHQKGIIHRDLKPSNILVAQYDDRPVPKVIDFGIAKATHQKLTEKTLYTQLGQIVGTLEYMSPEQAVLNQLDVDTRSDVYSLGVILYELLVGVTPLDGKELRSQGLEQMLRSIREKEPPRPSLRLSSQGKAASQTAAYQHTDQSTLSRTLRGDLDWIVMKALEKDRKRRYESASRLREDLDHYLVGTTVEARPPTIGYRLQKYAQRNRVGLSVSGAMIAIMAIAMVWVTRERNVAVGHLQRLRDTVEELAFNEACNGNMPQFERWQQQLLSIETPRAQVETLRGIALFTSGAAHEGTEVLKRIVAADPDNQLATAALVWAAYISGDYLTTVNAAQRLDELDDGDTDFARTFVAFATTFQPGDADKRSIRTFTQILDKHPRWGFVYLCRSLAFADLAVRSKEAEHLRNAIHDIQIARIHMPQNHYVKGRALQVYIRVLAFDEVYPDRLSQLDMQYVHDEASQIADELTSSNATFDGFATALMYFRLVNDPRADSLEERLDRSLRHDRQAAASAFADGTSLQLELGKTNRSFLWLVFQTLAHKEGENKDAVDAALDELSQLVANNTMRSSVMVSICDLLENDRAKSRVIDDARGSFFLGEWMLKPIEFHTGQISADELLQEAYPFPNEMCIAHFTVGVQRLSEGNREEAIRHFRQVKQTGRYGWNQYHAAKAFLTRLENREDDFPSWITDSSLHPDAETTDD